MPTIVVLALLFFIPCITSWYDCDWLRNDAKCQYDDCPNGRCYWVSPPNANLCVDNGGNFCPAPRCVIRLGYYCSAERGVDPQPCPPGQYQPWAKNWWNWAPCQGCPPGTYSGLGAGSCSQCPAGSYTPNWQSTGCLTCPAGSSCPPGSANPALCIMGTYSLAAASACLQCPAGTYVSVVGSTWYKDCPPGFSCPPGSISPIICPLGTYSPGKSANCLKCSYGSYTANSGSSSCLPCPANPFMGSSDDGACLCEAGYFAA